MKGPDDVEFKSVSDDPWRWSYRTSQYRKRDGVFKKPYAPIGSYGEYELLASDQGGGFYDMIATTKDDEVVGSVFFGPWDGRDTSRIEGAVEVDPRYRRKGIASAMYAAAEQLSGKKLRPARSHTPLAEALWKGRSRRFGAGGSASENPSEGQAISDVGGRVVKNPARVQHESPDGRFHFLTVSSEEEDPYATLEAVYGSRSEVAEEAARHAGVHVGSDVGASISRSKARLVGYIRWIETVERQKGVGRSMLEAVMDELYRRGAREVFLVAEPDRTKISLDALFRFYESAGFDHSREDPRIMRAKLPRKPRRYEDNPRDPKTGEDENYGSFFLLEPSGSSFKILAWEEIESTAEDMAEDTGTAYAVDEETAVDEVDPDDFKNWADSKVLKRLYGTTAKSAYAAWKKRAKKSGGKS